MGPADATQAAFNPLAGNPLRTRGDLLTALDRLHRPLEACRSACGSRVEIEGTAAVYDDGAAALESFARPMWGLASAAAGETGGDAWWPSLAAGLRAGTDRGGPSYWGDIADFDQRIVELPAIAFALAVAPGRLVAPGSADARRVADYLRQARGRRVFANNWLLFPALIEVGLHALGEARDDGRIEQALAAVERFHLGEGWYRDGDASQIDHYGGFAFHFYALLLTRLAPDAVDRTRIAARAGEFARGYSRWFDSEGAAIPFGRSLTYRFAMGAFFGACAFAGVEALPWGEMKGIFLRHLRWWSRQPIARPGGLLSIGHACPNTMMAEEYNGPASPYWAFKAFLPLALGEDHPFWRAEEAPPPSRQGTCVIPQAGMVLREEQGRVTALCGGQSNLRFSGGAEKYGKFAYSSRYGFSVEGPLRRYEDGCFDSMIALDDGSGWRVREENSAEIVDEVLVSRWRPWPDVEVVTRLRWSGLWQVRSHRIRTPRPLRAIEGGFCLPHPGRSGMLGDAGAGAAWAEAQGDFSGIVALGDGRTGRLHQPAPNRHLYHPRVIVPQLIGHVAAGESRTDCAVLAGGDPGALRAAWALPPAMLP